MPRDEMTRTVQKSSLNVYIAVIKLRFSEGISKSVSQSVSKNLGYLEILKILEQLIKMG